MNSKSSKYILVFITVLCVFLMVSSYLKASWLTPVRNVTSYVLVPVQKSISSFGITINDKINERAELKQIYEKNKELEIEIDRLNEENTRLRSETKELERLRELLKLDLQYQQYPTIGARVIGNDSSGWFKIFRIDKGASDGIRKDMNVISGSGLVGIITEVGSNYSTVRSIIDDESNVYAMSQYSNDTCLVHGNSTLYRDGLLELSNIDKNADFKDGDAVITSNLSTKYLPGILIGYASDISLNAQHLTKSGTLIPVADFENISEVLVITQIKTDSGIITPGEE